ncbi:MAG: hypothetical protein AMXMBFR58_14340 [Phycisphaerae bacterium]
MSSAPRQPPRPPGTPPNTPGGPGARPAPAARPIIPRPAGPASPARPVSPARPAVAPGTRPPAPPAPAKPPAAPPAVAKSAPAPPAKAPQPETPPPSTPEKRRDLDSPSSTAVPLAASKRWLHDADFYAPDFFYLCRLLETAYPNLPRLGSSSLPSFDVVRFVQEPSLAFPPVTIPRFKAMGEARAGRVYVNFMGMLGPHGPLPLHLTEYARDRERNASDPTLARFLDIFNHRMISLFYRAWSVNQMTVSADRPDEDRYVTYVGSLCGLGMPSLMRRDDLPDEAKLHYCGRLSHPTRNAEGLEAIVRSYFGVRAQVIEFVGRWLDLPERDWCHLGARRASTALGRGAVVGSRTWDVQSCIRIRLGPLKLRDYCRLLPGGPSHKRLIAWVRNYVGFETDFEFQLVLEQPEVPEIRLGGPRETGSRLGWTTWLRSLDASHDRDDLVTQGDRTVRHE